MKTAYNGKFIVLDGPDGCGKSTQQKRLAGWLTDGKAQVVCFRDPGTTVIGEKIRHILLDTAHAAMSDNTEVLLYMAARAQLWKECIAPAMAEGKCVLMDRWLSSTCAYQGQAGNFGIDKVLHVAQNSLDRVWPDLTIILDVDIQTAQSRMNRPLDRMEQKSAAYHQQVRQGYLELCRRFDHCIRVDAAGQPDDVFGQIRRVVEQRFNKAL